MSRTVRDDALAGCDVFVCMCSLLHFATWASQSLEGKSQTREYSSELLEHTAATTKTQRHKELRFSSCLCVFVVTAVCLQHRRSSKRRRCCRRLCVLRLEDMGTGDASYPPGRW